MDTIEMDRRALNGLADACGMDPDEPICPDIDRIARQDLSLRAKLRVFRDEAVENMREAKKA